MSTFIQKNKLRALSMSIVLLVSGCTGLLPNQVFEQNDSGGDIQKDQLDGTGNSSSDKSNSAVDQTEDASPRFTVPLKAAIATQPANNSLLVMDIEQGKAVGTIPVGNYPVGLALDKMAPRKFAYVANYGSNAIAFVNLQSNAVESFVESGESPWDVKVNSAGNYLYSANSGDNSVSVIDIARKSRVRKVFFSKSDFPGFRARNIVINPAVADDAFVISDQNSGTVSYPNAQIVRLDSQSIRTVYTINSALSLGKAAITPDGKRLLVTDRERATLWSLDLGTGAPTPIALPYPSDDVVVLPDSKTAIVSLPEMNAITTVYLEANVVGAPHFIRDDEYSGFSPKLLAVNPDGPIVWIIGGGINGLARVSNPGSPIDWNASERTHFGLNSPLGDFALIP